MRNFLLISYQFPAYFLCSADGGKEEMRRKF